MNTEIQTTDNQPSQAIWEWATMFSAVIQQIDLCVHTLDLDEGEGAMRHFLQKANHIAAIQPILNCDPADIQKVAAEGETFRAFFQLCKMRAAQIKATQEAAAARDSRAELQKLFGL